MPTQLDRREFLGSVSGFAAAVPAAAQAPRSGDATRPAWDLAWLDRLNTFRDVYHVEPPDMNVAVGIARTAFPVNASDALWDKYKLGELWKINGRDGKAATRNIFLGESSGGPAPMVRSLMARGAVFWRCNIALGGIASQLSGESGTPVDKVRAELVDGLIPGVKVVPAHSMAVGLVQERGFTYMRP
jgi:hypothetical protein